MLDLVLESDKMTPHSLLQLSQIWHVNAKAREASETGLLTSEAGVECPEDGADEEVLLRYE